MLLARLPIIRESENQVLGVGCQVLGVGCQVSGARSQVSGLMCRVLGLRGCVSGIKVLSVSSVYLSFVILSEVRRSRT